MIIPNLSLWLAFGAGFLSFISPCCLPLYPSYLSYITGVTVKDLRDEQGMFQKKAMIHTFFFIIGFSLIFFALGLSANAIGNLFTNYKTLIRQLGGLLVFLMGLMMLGVFQPRWLMKEKRAHFQSRPGGYFGSILVGITFAAGWTPCIGPILATILTMGVADPNKAISYISAYTLGFAVPFFVMAFFLSKIKGIQTFSHISMKVGGGFMLLSGILLYTDQMTKITTVLIRLFGGFTGF